MAPKLGGTPIVIPTAQIARYVSIYPDSAPGSHYLSGFINNPAGVNGIYLQYWTEGSGVVFYEADLNPQGWSMLLVPAMAAYTVASMLSIYAPAFALSAMGFTL
jgi:hypothetical protein